MLCKVWGFCPEVIYVLVNKNRNSKLLVKMGNNVIDNYKKRDLATFFT